MPLPVPKFCSRRVRTGCCQAVRVALPSRCERSHRGVLRVAFMRPRGVRRERPTLALGWLGLLELCHAAVAASVQAEGLGQIGTWRKPLDQFCHVACRIERAGFIAFAIGICAWLGRAVPTSLKMLLLAVAIIDDLLAIGV